VTHDYKRHGTTTLFAALAVLEGTVISRCMQRHRHQEFLRFLNAVERGVPAGKVTHAIPTTMPPTSIPRASPGSPGHPRWVFHFTPTSGSWLNAVETFFSALTRRRIHRGSFHSIVDLQAAINRYVAEHNDAPKPFAWTKPVPQIVAKMNRLNASAHQPLHAAPSGPDFIRFKHAVERAAPTAKAIHGILAGPFTSPPSGSWLNAMERFFSAHPLPALARWLSFDRRPAGSDPSIPRLFPFLPRLRAGQQREAGRNSREARGHRPV
jgi:hypothetical protein